MDKVLVTGGTGFIGNHIVRKLCAQGYSVRVLTRPTSPLDLIESLPVEIATGDLTDKASLQKAVAGCRFIFHVAADYRLWAADPQELYRSNVDGTANLLAAAFEPRQGAPASVERFIYTSTVGTIGFHDGVEAGEESFPSPDQLAGHYKKSKFQAEQVALQYACQGRPVIIVNPTAPVGEGDRRPTDTGKMILDFINRRMPAYIDTGLNLVDVRDVAEGHLAALCRGRIGERYILGGRNMTLAEILQALSRITGIPAPSVCLPYTVALCAAVAEDAIGRVTGRTPRAPLEGVRMARHKMWVSSAKAERELGYHSHSVEAALARAIDWFREKGMARPA